MLRRAFLILAVFLCTAACAGEPNPPQTDPPPAEVPPAPVQDITPQQAQSLRVVTWNILYGADQGDKENTWPKRRVALKELLSPIQPDILCVQEALLDQVHFLEKTFPKHKRLGVGRDDGKEAGEFCAMLYNPERLECVESGTFWLGETTEKPGLHWGEKYNRICTWARFQDKLEQKKFVVYNTHFPLNPIAKQRAAHQMAKKINADFANEPKLLLGDFNCGPGSKEWRVFNWIGLSHAQMAAGEPLITKTFHYEGFPVSALDAIFASRGWRVRSYKVIEDRVDKLLPSDHYGIVAGVALSGPGPEKRDVFVPPKEPEPMAGAEKTVEGGE